LIEQHGALCNQLVTKSRDVAIAGADADVAQQARDVDAVIEAEQRGAIRALAVDHAVEQRVAHAGEHRSDRVAEQHAERLLASDERLEPRAHAVGVRRDRTQRERGWNLTEPPRLASGVQPCVALALRELATQLPTEAKQMRHVQVRMHRACREVMESELSRVIASGDAMLFTGAGFSVDARDAAGEPLPDSRGMARDLWRIAFGDDAGEPDESTLADLYDVALAHAPEQLAAYLARRLRVGDGRLPPYYAAWFAAPWRRIYTLNVDDLERAVQAQFELPRPLRSVSAIGGAAAPDPRTLDVVHLNGLVGGDVTEVTFSTLQYAARLCGRDRAYEQLAVDLTQAPFVFVGTTLDEVTLWKHLEVQRQKTGGRHRAPALPRSFLISRSLPRARQVLLATCNIEWVRGTVDSVLTRS